MKLKRYAEYTQNQLITTTHNLINKLYDFLTGLGITLNKSNQRLEFVNERGIHFIFIKINYDDITGIKIQLYSEREWSSAREFLRSVFNEFSYDTSRYTHAFDSFNFKLESIENVIDELTEENFELFDTANNYNL